MKHLALTLLFLPTIGFANEQTLSADPTRIITSVGANLSSDFSENSVKFSGSLALDEIRKINVSSTGDGSEWRIGGSWLFDIGIVNFSIGKTLYDHDASQTNYSVGTFIPLSVFGFKPWDIQIFPMAGYTYNEGDIATETHPQQNNYPVLNSLNSDYVLVSSSSHSGYLGAFALKPLTEKWVAMAVLGGSMGSNDYSGSWAALGANYTINEHNNISLLGFAVDSSYGDDAKIALSYSYEF